MPGIWGCDEVGEWLVDLGEASAMEIGWGKELLEDNVEEGGSKLETVILLRLIREGGFRFSGEGLCGGGFRE